MAARGTRVTSVAESGFDTLKRIRLQVYGRKDRRRDVPSGTGAGCIKRAFLRLGGTWSSSGSISASSPAVRRLATPLDRDESSGIRRTTIPGPGVSRAVHRPVPLETARRALIGNWSDTVRSATVRAGRAGPGHDGDAGSGGAATRVCHFQTPNTPVPTPHQVQNLPDRSVRGVWSWQTDGIVVASKRCGDPPRGAHSTSG